MQFLALEPMLQVENIAATRAWYAAVLGFSADPESGPEWCRLSRDGISIMFMRNEHLGTPHATATQYFRVDDVMALWESVRPHCRAEWGPERMPYGMIEFAIRDPNGYLLSFGEPIA